MKNISDELLITSYLKAKELDLDNEFLGQLKEEIDYRLLQSNAREVIKVILLSGAMNILGQRYQ